MRNDARRDAMMDKRASRETPCPDQLEYLRRLFRLAASLSPLPPTKAKAYEILEASRWPKEVDCPFCRSKQTSLLTGGRNRGRRKRYCRSCQGQFSPLAGTPLANEKAPPEIVVAAASLASECRGPLLAEALEERAGVDARSSARLALKMQDLYEHSLHMPAGKSPRSGLARYLKVGAAIAASLLAGGIALILARSGSEPLHATWMHGGRLVEWSTDRRPGEDRPSWLQRHGVLLAKALEAYPPDQPRDQ